MVMAVFAYIYHQSFVVPQNFSVEIILDQVKGIALRIPSSRRSPHPNTLDIDSKGQNRLLFSGQILMSLSLEEQQALFVKLGQTLQERMTGKS